MIAIVALAACNLPPLSLRFTLTGGDSQRCIGDTGNETTDCSEVTMQCDAVLSVRVVPPAKENIPYITVCQPLAAAPRKLCSIASVDLPQPSVKVPAQVLEVQMAIFDRDSLALDANLDPICPIVKFAANDLAEAAIEPCTDSDPCPPQPAVAGRTFYHPGDAETVVELGCANPDLLKKCKPTSSLVVTAGVNDFETTVSVSPATADALTVSIDEPIDDLNGGFKLPRGNVLDRIVPDPSGGPSWRREFTDLQFLTSSVCLQVLEDLAGTATTLNCASPIPFNMDLTEIDMVGLRLPRATLNQILAALGLIVVPPQGLVVGIVLNQFFNPVQGAVVTTDAGTVKYLSLDRLSVSTTSTSANGIFISQDAPYGSLFHWNGQDQFGGLVDDKVTIVILQKPI